MAPFSWAMSAMAVFSFSSIFSTLAVKLEWSPRSSDFMSVMSDLIPLMSRCSHRNATMVTRSVRSGAASESSIRNLSMMDSLGEEL